MHLRKHSVSAEPFPLTRVEHYMTEHSAGGGAADRPSVTDPGAASRHAEYWRRNIRLVGVFLVVWFTVSYGFGIIFVDALDTFRLPGTNFPLGFWFAQQGAIYVFVVLIFIYVRLMNALDREFGVDEGGDA